MNLESLFTVLLPILAGGLATLLMNWLKSGVALVNTLPAIAKQLIVGAASWGLVKLSLWGIALSTFDITQLGNADMLALSSAGLSFLFYLTQKKPVA